LENTVNAVLNFWRLGVPSSRSKDSLFHGLGLRNDFWTFPPLATSMEASGIERFFLLLLDLNSHEELEAGAARAGMAPALQADHGGRRECNSPDLIRNGLQSFMCLWGLGRAWTKCTRLGRAPSSWMPASSFSQPSTLHSDCVPATLFELELR